MVTNNNDYYKGELNMLKAGLRNAIKGLAITLAVCSFAVTGSPLCEAEGQAVVEAKGQAVVEAKGQAAVQTVGNSQGAVLKTYAGENDASQNTIVFTKSSKKITAGRSFQFEAELMGDSSAKISWKVDKTKYAAIDENGLLTTQRAGTIRVSASADTANGAVAASVKVKIKPKKIIAIDAGHQARANGNTEPVGPGASTRKAKVAGGTTGVYTRVPEYKLTLAVAKKLETELKERGYKVVQIRKKNNVNISNKERAEIANENSDIYIRLHADAAGSSSVTGASALYPSARNRYVGSLSKKSKKLSDCVLSSMCKKAGTKSRGCIVRDDLTGTNWSKIPVTLIEMGFMTNKQEDIKMQDDDYQNSMVKGMANGIDKYFGYK